MKSSTVWHGHSTRPSLPAGTARKASGSLLHGRQSRLIMQTTKNRKFPLGNSLSYLSCVAFCRVRPSGRTLFLYLADFGNLCFRISSSTDTCVELVGARFLHLLTQTIPSLKSPTGAFIASQTLIFRRKQIIRTHLLSETSSDYFCLVRVARIELTAS